MWRGCASKFPGRQDGKSISDAQRAIQRLKNATGHRGQHYLAPELEDLREPTQQVCDKILALCNVQPIAVGKVAKLR
jgi:hypothetical protein